MNGTKIASTASLILREKGDHDPLGRISVLRPKNGVAFRQMMTCFFSLFPFPSTADRSVADTFFTV